MKKFCLLLLLVILAVACSEKNNTPVENKPPDFSESYFPMWTGFKYTYKIESTVYTLEIKGTVKMKGKTYYKWLVDFNGSALFYRASGDSVFSQGLWDDKGVQISEDETLILLQNAPVGKVWKDTIIREDEAISYFEYEILQRGATRTVEGKVYNDVIVVSDIQSLAPKTEPDLILISLESLIYYAKGVGIIEMDYGFTRRTLMSYDLGNK